MEFKNGEMVAAYTSGGRLIVRIQDASPILNGTILVSQDDLSSIRLHPKQLRKLKKPRVWWINEAFIRNHGLKAEASWSDWFESPNGAVISTAEPEDKTGWIKLVEAKV